MPRDGFATINRAYGSTFRPGELTLGLVVPIEHYPHGPVPSMQRHVERIQLAEELGFSAVWLRDVPFNVPSFGDAGQVFDPFVYLGLLAGATSNIGLGIASAILPLRHPAHVAKAAATADALSGGRMLLGVASGDRPAEYPAMAVPFEERGARFRESFEYLQAVWSGASIASPFGEVGASLELGPRPPAGRVPTLITGSSRQDADWIAAHADGWMTYPRNPAALRQLVDDYRRRVEGSGIDDKPVMQPLYIDLVDRPLPHGPEPIHLGLRLSVDDLLAYLDDALAAGMNHVALNLRFNETDVEATLRRLAAEVLPRYAGSTPTDPTHQEQDA